MTSIRPASSTPARRKLLYLSRRDIEDIALPMEQVVEAVGQVFAEKGQGKIEMPPKPGIHPRPDSSIRAMLAYIPSIDAAGVKWISGYGHNYIAGLPNIQGLVILNDCETGVPKTLMDCTWITAKRTGAATCVAAQYLARSDSKTLGLVACGALARTNLEALRTRFAIERIQAYDVDSARAEAFAREIRERTPIEVVVAKGVREAVDGMDLVVTSGPIVHKPKPPIRASWLAPGSFTCALDFDAYLTPEAFAEVDRLVTDDRAQLEYFRGSGYFRRTPEPHCDLGQVAAGRRAGRRRRRERTVAILLGIGVLDIAVGSLLDARARELGIGTELPF